jgi:hypothetical protein
LAYVIERRAKGRKYFYFRIGVDGEGRGGTLVPLPGVPGMRDFGDRYEQLLAEHKPKVLHVKRGHDAPGTLGWVIQKFCAEENATTSPWSKLEPTTQAVYRRHFDWLRENFGDMLLAAFDKALVRRIRDLRKAHPSVANMTVDKIGQLWAWAEEYADIILPGANPARQVASLPVVTESAPAWPRELCAGFESCDHPRMVTFYFLARYTGQRKGDCCAMRWSDFDGRRIQIMAVLGHLTEKQAYTMCGRLIGFGLAMMRDCDMGSGRQCRAVAPRGRHGRGTEYGETGKPHWKNSG